MEYNNLIELIATVAKSNLKDFRYEDGETKLLMSSGERTEPVSQKESPDHKEPEKRKDHEEGRIVKSPLVGTFYRTPSEDAKPFVSVGDSVKKGQVLAIVEAMKLMNDIESEYEGEIKEIYPENGSMVEYGQPLFRIM